MSFLSRPIKYLPVLVLLGAAQGAYSQEASPWADGHRSRVRLVAGGPAAQGQQLAGVEIALDPGFKTYWRNPGESGLPPSFDWSQSSNVKAVEVLWPAPARSEDAGGVSYGYADRVLFPVHVRPTEPAKPVRLALKIDYGVCKDICIPAQAELSLTLPKDVAPSSRALIETALARVPRQQPLRAEGDLSVLGVEPVAADGKSKVLVKVRAPAASSPRLFVEAPDNWFLLPAAEPARIGGDAQTEYRFPVEILERPHGATGPIAFRWTLVAGGKAVETTTSLDAARLPQ